MSRSKRKNYVFPWLSGGMGGQKKWKQQINRIFRRNAKIKLHNSIDENGEVLTDYFYRDLKKRPFADEWSSPSDGHQTIKMLTKEEFDIHIRENSYLAVPRRTTTNYKDYVANFKRTIISK